MATAEDLQAARLLKQRLENLTPIRQYMVYGSRARGEAEMGSDLDIFLEVPEVTPNLRQQVYEAAWEVGFDHNLVISILLVSTQSLINSPLAANPILYAIRTEGIAL